MSGGSRVSLVTGAGSGIGRAIAEKLAKEGKRVIVNDLDGASAEEVVAGIKASGVEAAAAPGDVSDPDAVRGMVEAAREVFRSALILGRPRDKDDPLRMTVDGRLLWALGTALDGPYDRREHLDPALADDGAEAA